MEIASTARTLGRDFTVVDLVPPLDRLRDAVTGARAVRHRTGGGRLVVTAWCPVLCALTLTGWV